MKSSRSEESVEAAVGDTSSITHEEKTGKLIQSGLYKLISTLIKFSNSNLFIFISFQSYSQ
jgi:hypothetical protein